MTFIKCGHGYIIQLCIKQQTDMKTLLKLEEFGGIIISLFLFQLSGYNWWLYPILFFTPDISMLGYLANKKVGAITYNIFHHKLVAILIAAMGLLDFPVAILIGSVLLGHICLDRLLGYGLKYDKGFKFTHFGEIGR